ncbi:unnamed protein product [Orchesella dallaii]|uniref:Uncharacterized protein n=1 Tax=Orchesella dallaii TaxID=48710 RepID=A0ABP1RJ42_9HEXA
MKSWAITFLFVFTFFNFLQPSKGDHWLHLRVMRRVRDVSVQNNIQTQNESTHGTYHHHDETDFLTLEDGLSIREIYDLEKEWGNVKNGTLLEQQQDDQELSICEEGTFQNANNQTIEAIERTLKFYESHYHMMTTVDSMVGLLFLKRVDDENNQKFQKSYPLVSWAEDICTRLSGDEQKKCRALIRNTKSQFPPIKPHELVTHLVESGHWGVIGSEKEYLWARLNVECQTALLLRCEIPYICARTLFDPVPRSQYFLTHQALMRILAEESDCPNIQNYLENSVNDQLCTKMYLEAQLIAQMGYPHSLRDLFSEYVAFCGYLGYPNFIRSDWLQAIISWQSQSDYGCFIYDDEYLSPFDTTEVPINRINSASESGTVCAKNDEIESSGCDSKQEVCLTHFTSVSLSALAMNWYNIESYCGLH